MIVVYVVFCSWVGFMLFKGSPQGVQYFVSLPETCWQMFILLTTANYPDVMLPAYQMGTGYVIFFVGYLVVFFFLNLLLAVTYSNYKKRVEESIGSYVHVREDYLQDKFFQFDVDKKGYLYVEECKLLIISLLALDPSHDEDNIDVDKFVATLDSNINGEITLKEFYSYFDVMDILQFEQKYRDKEYKTISNFQTKLRKIMQNPFFDLVMPRL